MKKQKTKLRTDFKEKKMQREEFRKAEEELEKQERDM